MNLIFSMALRNGLRSWRRSLLTAAAITLGTALLDMGMSWVDGVLNNALDQASAVAGHVRVVTPGWSAKESLLPLSENLPKTDPMLTAIAQVPGVKGAWPRIQLPATVSVGDEMGDVFSLLEGAPDAYFTDILKLDQHLSAGRMLKGDKEVVVGATLAQEAKLKVGDEVIFLGQTQDGSLSPIKESVVGIADFGSRQQNKLAYITLERARYMADIPDGATEIVIYGPNRDNAEAVAAAVGALPGFEKLEVKAWSQRKPWSDLVALFKPVVALFALVIVLLTGLVVLNTMLMSVLERTGEIGVLRALGMNRRETVQLFVVEALGIAVIGGVFGAVLGALGAWYLCVHGVNLGAGVDKVPATIPINSTVYGKFEWITFVKGMLLALVMAGLGSLLPALRASAVTPIEAIRQRH
jgi:putative ABC transport system permease protein